MIARGLIAWALLTAMVVVPIATARDSVPTAPPPRAVEDTRCYRAYFEDCALPVGKTSETGMLAVRWRVRVEVRRLVWTGKDVIDFHWGVKYVGRRAPLIMIRPSFTDSMPGATQADFYAFPPGEQKGRWLTLPDPENLPGPRPGILDLPPGRWFLEAPRGKWDGGRETISVDELKEALRARFPGEFSSDSPPKVYTVFRHKARDRGMALDAWTGDLESDFLEVPDLNRW